MFNQSDVKFPFEHIGNLKNKAIKPIIITVIQIYVIVGLRVPKNSANGVLFSFCYFVNCKLY